MKRGAALIGIALVLMLASWVLLRDDSRFEPEPDVVAEPEDTLAVEPIPDRHDPGFLEVRVSNVDGEPIPGVEITMRGKAVGESKLDDHAKTLTDFDGWGELVIPEEVMASSQDDLWLVFSHPDLCWTRSHKTNKFAEELAYELRLRSDLVVVPRILEGEIETCTLNWMEGPYDPRENVRVADARELPFELEGLCEEQIWILLEARATNGEDWVSPWTEVALSPGKTEEVGLPLERWSSLEGRLLSSDGAHVPGASVLVFATDRSALERRELPWSQRRRFEGIEPLETVTDEEGRFRVDELIQGPGWVFAHGGGAHTSSKLFSRPPLLVANPVNLVAGHTEVELSLQEAPSVVWRFVDGRDVPLSGLSVQAEINVAWMEDPGRPGSSLELSRTIDLSPEPTDADGRISLPEWAAAHARLLVLDSRGEPLARTGLMDFDPDGETLVRIP